MERRRFLQSVGLVGAAGFGGCTGPGPVGADPEPTADELETWERYPGRGDVPAAEDAPAIRFEPSEDRVSVEGTVAYSSSSCRTLGVGAVAYDDGVLRVTVRAEYEEEEPEGGTRLCTDDIVVEDYEVVLTFDDGLPERVVAAERDGRGEPRRTTRER